MSEEEMIDLEITLRRKAKKWYSISISLYYFLLVSLKVMIKITADVVILMIIFKGNQIHKRDDNMREQRIANINKILDNTYTDDCFDIYNDIINELDLSDSYVYEFSTLKDELEYNPNITIEDILIACNDVDIRDIYDINNLMFIINDYGIELIDDEQLQRMLLDNIEYYLEDLITYHKNILDNIGLDLVDDLLLTKDDFYDYGIEDLIDDYF